MHSIEREAATRDGGFFLVRLMPYRTTDDRIEGAFIDITVRKVSLTRLEGSGRRCLLQHIRTASKAR